MKKTTIFIIIIAAIGLGVYWYTQQSGDSNYSSDTTTYLSVSQSDIVAPKLGATGSFSIDYDGHKWAIINHPSWTNVERYKNSGDEYTREHGFGITVKPNRTGFDREGVVTIASGKQTASIRVFQRGKATSVSPVNTMLRFGRSGGTQSLYFSTDGQDWRASTNDSWLDVSYNVNDCDLTIRCAQNTGSPREGTVYITEDDISLRIHVNQDGNVQNSYW